MRSVANVALIYRKKIASDAFLASGAIFLGGAIRFLQERNGQTSHHDTYHRHQLDEDIERWTRGILEWVAYGIAYNRSLMILTTLASEVALLYHLLGIVPGTT